MTDAVANGKSGENNGNESSEKSFSLETETLSKNSRSRSQDTPQSGATHVSLAAQKKDTDDPVRDKPGDKLINDTGGTMRNPRRKSKSACRARSHDPKKCQMNFRDMIGKHEMRNEELEQLEGDLRERLDMLECSMPAVMVWNILRTAQGAPPSVVRRLMEKQFQGVHSAGNIAIPSSPSQHYDYRVREMEAERKEAVRRVEEARALLTDKEAAIQERRKRLEEAKKCNQEKKERVERLHREAVQVRESMKTARGDDTSHETGEFGAIRCKEKLLGDIGSLSSIDSTDLECFAKLQELAESEVCMKQQISELERREEVYMRTLQQADELWSKMEGESSDDVRELQQQLNLKTAANQQLADRVCQLEDEQERLKKRLITCNDQLAKFTDKEHANAEVGFKDGVATIMDHGIEAQVPTATTFTSASPQTFDVDSTARPQTKDKESTFTPESVEKSISVGPKTFDKDIEAIVDLVDREVDKPVGLVLDAGVGEEALDDSIEKMDYPSGRPSDKVPRIRPEEQEKITETSATLHWDDGYPPGSIPKDMVESSTGTDNVPLLGKVATTEMPVQATVEMMEQPVGGSDAEDIAETVDEFRPPAKDDNAQDTGLLPMTRAPEGEKKTPPLAQPHKQPTSQDESPVREPPKAIDESSRTMDDERKSEIDESIEVIDEPVTDELRFKRPAETNDKNTEPIIDRIKTDTHETTQKTDGPDSEKKSVRETTSDKDSDDVIDKLKGPVRQIARKIRLPESEKTARSKRETLIDEDDDTVSDQVERIVATPITDSDKIVPESKKEPDRSESIRKSTYVTPARVEKSSEESVEEGVEESTQPKPGKKDSLPKRRKKSSKTNEVIPADMESDSDEGPQTTHYPDSEEKTTEKYTRSVTKKPKNVEKKKRKGRSSKQKPRDEEKIETDDDEDIPEAWKDWDWDKGCPPDMGCGVSNSPTPVADKRPKDVSTLESQVQATVEMRERSVGGRGSEDIAEIDRGDKPPRNTIEKATDSSPEIQGTHAADPTGEKTNEIVLSREELRNWYNTVNSIHHTISQCTNCQFHVDATTRLMQKMNNHLWIMALADEELPATDDELTKSLTHMTEQPIESIRDLGARASEPRKSEVPNLATESISPDNFNDILPDTSQLLDEDLKRSSEKDETLDISTGRSVTLLEDDFDVDKSTDQLVTLTEAEPSLSEIEANPLDEDGKETPKVSLQPSLQVPVEDELSMPLGTERRPLSQEEPSAIIEPEDQQAESAKPPAVEEGEILESEKKHEEETKRPEKIIGAEQRMEEEQEITKHHDVDISPALKPESEPDKKQQPLEACICSPQICRPVITCIPEPPTGGTQTAPQMPRTLHRLMLKTKTESPRRPPEVITWHRPLIWTRRREDKSTLTTARVGTQADSTSGRERITHRRNGRKDDCTCSGLIPKKIDFGESYEHAPRRHPDERLPTPVRHTVAELPGSLRPQQSTISNEHEIAVTQYTSKISSQKSSDPCCVNCGRPITPEPTSVSLKAKIRADTESPKSLMHTLKKSTSSVSRMEQKKNLCCDCAVLQGTRIEETSEDVKSEFEKGFTYHDNFCCPCPVDIENEQTKDSTKRSKKKRKPEKKDQSVTANIPRGKKKKMMKNKRNLDDGTVSSKPESQIHSPSIQSSSKHSGNSVAESHDDKSCNKMDPETGGSVKRSAPKLSSYCAPSPCGCSDNNSAQVPYTNYSAIFGPDINRNDCHYSSSNESTTHKSLGRKYNSQEPN